MNIVFFQFGDYGEAYRRLAQGGIETFRDQKRSVDYVAALRDHHRVITVAISGRPHREELAENLWSIGIDTATAFNPTRLLPLMAELDPGLLISRSPHYALHLCISASLHLWARLRNVTTLPMFADTLSTGGLRQTVKNHLLRFALSGKNVPCIANHSLNASLTLESVLHLPATRIVPWERPLLAVNPDIKPPFPDPMRLRAFFAGTLSVEKGVGDCLAAAALLRDQGIRLELDFAGAGDIAVWKAETERLGIADRVRFLGKLANDEVRQRMREADIVLVPSRHDYAEGLPNTLCEGLAARSVLVASDHPAFASRLRPDEDSIVFRAADPKDMADQITRVAADPVLQVRLSRNAAAAHDALHIGINRFLLTDLFFEDPRNKTGWVSRHSLQTLRINGQKTRS